MRCRNNNVFLKEWITKQVLFILIVTLCVSMGNAQTISKKKAIKTQKGQKSKTTSTTTITHYTPPPRPKAKWDDVLLKESDLTNLLADVKSDSTLQIERLAAFHFHQLINEYRIRNKKGWLYWDDRLWLAARNHNIYLEFECDGHYQTKERPFFSGTDAGERLKYVINNHNTVSWSGENVYCGAKIRGKSVEEVAKHMADAAFECWKRSPGHNQNMLFDKSTNNGTSFYICKDSSVVVTSLFAYWCENSSDKNIAIFWDNGLAARNISNFVVRDGKVFSRIPEDDLKATVMEMIEAKMPKDKSTMDDGMRMAASKHLLYLKTNKSRSTIQSSKGNDFYETTTEKRYLKAINYRDKWYSFRRKPKVAEKCFVIPIELTDFLDNTVFSTIDKKIAHAFPPISNIKKWGAVVDFSKVNDQYQCIIDVVLVEK